MTIHKEGYSTLVIVTLFLVVLHIVSDQYLGNYPMVQAIILGLSIVLFLIVLQFFRHPERKILRNDRQVFAPADGKVVVIEETVESEVLKDKRIQVSIFMSPINVHVNRYPVSGQVTYCRYHPEKEVDEHYAQTLKLLEDLEFKCMLGNEEDQLNAILNINSGAGGTESQDWGKEEAEDHFYHYEPIHEIGNEVDFVCGEAKRIRLRYPKITVVPLIYKVEDNKLYLVNE